MSTPAEVRAAWDDVFLTSNLQAITTKAYEFDAAALAPISQAHDSKLRYAQRINFFQYRVAKAREFLMTSRLWSRFDVIVEYYKEAGIDGSDYTDVEDALETLFNQVRTTLSDTWSGTVDYWRVQEGPANLELVVVNNVPCWRGRYVFQGFSEQSL
jgi:hypothetical protein